MPKVGELILLAAPSCCGKTYFLEQLRGGRLPRLVSRTGLDPKIDSYVSVIPRELRNYGGTYVPRMILHFAIPTIALTERTLESFDYEPRLDVVKSAEEVTVLTLLASSNVLASRLRSRTRTNRRMVYRNFPKYLAERRKMAKLKQIYAVPDNVIGAYEAWLRYVSSLPNLRESWLVTADSDYEAFEPHEWERIKTGFFATTP